MKKSQLIAEFTVFLALGFFLLVLFASLIGSEIVSMNNKKETSAITDIGLMTKNEIDLAAQVLPGYSRNFTLPDDIDGVPYNISIIQRSLIVSTSGKEIIYRIPQVSGNIGKGINMVRNENGLIYIN